MDFCGILAIFDWIDWVGIGASRRRTGIWVPRCRSSWPSLDGPRKSTTWKWPWRSWKKPGVTRRSEKLFVQWSSPVEICGNQWKSGLERPKIDGNSSVGLHRFPSLVTRDDSWRLVTTRDDSWRLVNSRLVTHRLLRWIGVAHRVQLRRTRYLGGWLIAVSVGGIWRWNGWRWRWSPKYPTLSNTFGGKKRASYGQFFWGTDGNFDKPWDLGNVFKGYFHGKLYKPCFKLLPWMVIIGWSSPTKKTV